MNRIFRLQLREVFTVIAMAMAVTAFASKAASVEKQVALTDGRTVNVQLRGDEYVSFWLSSEGEVVFEENGIFRAATKKEIAEIDSLLKERDNMRTHAIEEALGGLMTNSATELRGERLFPHMGKPRVLVLLASFNNVDMQYGREEVDSMLNSTVTAKSLSSVAGYGSVAQYFNDCSDGLFVPQFDVYGPYKLEKDMSYYGADSGTRRDYRSADLFKDVCKAADAEVDFRQYDQDNDGYIDLVYVVHAGYAQNWGNADTCLWDRSSWGLSGGPYDGVYLYRGGVSAELACRPMEMFVATDGRPRIFGIGGFCHEFSHTLGLPDTYPTSTTGWSIVGGDYDNQSMEEWDLMDGGNNSINGFWPPMFNAFEKMLMGWTEIETLDKPQEVTLVPLMYGGKAYRIFNDNDSSMDEYWVLEALSSGSISQKWHARLPGKGMLMTYVNYNPIDFSLSNNSVNNTKGKPKFTVVPADGWLPSSYRVSSYGEYALTMSQFREQEAGDLFPGTAGVTEFNGYKAHTGKVDKPITNIVQNADYSVSFRFMMLPGDVNLDGKVTLDDARLVLDYYLADDKSTVNINLVTADVNGDGVITMADANAIVGICLGK